MRKISMTTVAMFTAFAFAATASAGDDKMAKKADPKDTKTTTTTTTTTTTSAPAGDAMAIPDPAPELLAAAKMMKGTFSCKGTMSMGADQMAAKGTIKWALDLDKMWIKG